MAPSKKKKISSSKKGKENGSTKSRAATANKKRKKEAPVSAAAPLEPKKKKAKIAKALFAQPVEIQFRPLASTIDAGEDEPFFPPTVDTSVQYAKGIRVHPTQWKSLKNGIAKVTYSDYLHCSSTRLTQPIMSSSEAALWQHKYAATPAANLQFPVSKHRFLGTITRRVTVLTKSKDKPTLRKRQPANFSDNSKPRKTITLATAKKLAEAEGVATKRRIAEIQSQWEAQLRESPDLQGKPAPWDTCGNLIIPEDSDADYVPLTDLLRWLNRSEDRRNEEDPDVAELLEILEACADLADPSHLWRIPLLIVYPIVTPVAGAKAAKKQSKATAFDIQMGIYGHRLLPMATTTVLGTVMNALDPDSYRVTAPLCEIPQPREPTFASSKYPVVTFDDEGGDGSLVGKENKPADDNHKEASRDDDDDDLPDDERKMPAKKQEDTSKPAAAAYDDLIGDDRNDAADRDDMQVSAFTTKGLLKLLENTGVAMTGYSTKIAPILSTQLNMDLLLHQQHGVQWMIQMEHLPGAKFGINSLLWEEREFLDGGRYFYCPSLGQMRLEPPADCKGGVLADVMGMGKVSASEPLRYCRSIGRSHTLARFDASGPRLTTSAIVLLVFRPPSQTIEVLGLILATLPELKQQAMEQGTSYATLIIVPPALVAQWQSEIVKATGDLLTVDYLDFRTGKITRRGSGATADIVLTTFNSLNVQKITKDLHETCWGRIVLVSYELSLSFGVCGYCTDCHTQREA